MVKVGDLKIVLVLLQLDRFCVVALGKTRGQLIFSFRI